MEKSVQRRTQNINDVEISHKRATYNKNDWLQTEYNINVDATSYVTLLIWLFVYTTIINIVCDILYKADNDKLILFGIAETKELCTLQIRVIKKMWHYKYIGTNCYNRKL